MANTSTVQEHSDLYRRIFGREFDDDMEIERRAWKATQQIVRKLSSGERAYMTVREWEEFLKGTIFEAFTEGK